MDDQHSGLAPDFQKLLPTRKAAHSEPDKRPIEFLWVFDPQEDKVHIEKGESDHPAHFPTHGEMAPEVTHPERLEGFAYSIIGGWRINDIHHHKLEDPHILRLVLAALRHEHPPAPLPSVLPHGDPLAGTTH